MKTANSGYTLIELLVVITIVAIVGVIAFINYQTFAQDQIVNKALGQIQSALRLAQSNATSGVVCLDSDNQVQGGVSWSVKFGSDKTKVEVYCEKNASALKTFQLENVEITSIKGSGCSTTTSPPVTVVYSTLYGILTFTGADVCLGASDKLTLTIKNLRNGNLRSFNLYKGGAIDVQ